MKRWFMLSLVIVAWTLVVPAVHASYKGQVVDAETKEPVEGVVVFMEWDEAHTWGHSYVDAYETLTDKEGRFTLPRYWTINLWKLLWTGPSVTIFKSGYQPVGPGYWGALLKVEWGLPKGSIVWKTEHGKPVLLLKRFKSVEEMRESHRIRDVEPGGRVPHEKWRLLREELKKELSLLRIPYPKDW